MYIITYRRKPVTLGRIAELESGGRNTRWFEYDWERQQYLASKTRIGAVERFLYYVGFTWQDRTKGIEVEKLPKGDVGGGSA